MSLAVVAVLRAERRSHRFGDFDSNSLRPRRLPSSSPAEEQVGILGTRLDPQGQRPAYSIYSRTRETATPYLGPIAYTLYVI